MSAGVLRRVHSVQPRWTTLDSEAVRVVAVDRKGGASDFCIGIGKIEKVGLCLSSSNSRP